MVNRLSRRAEPLMTPLRRLSMRRRPRASAGDLSLVGATERLVQPLRPWRRRPWAWGIALALHLAILLFVLLFVRIAPPPEDDSAPGVAVVFDNGGQPQTAAPPSPLKGMQDATAAQPPPPPASPPAQTANEEPEVNLNMPHLSMPEVPPMAVSTPDALPPRNAPPHRAQPRPTQRYAVMNGMSYGTGNAAAAPSPAAQQALNTSLPQSDAQAVNAPELTIKGKIGADWKAELSRWVNEHKYYPQAAAEQNQEGSVAIEFTVDRNGNVSGLRLLDGSGSPFLDQAWLGLFADNTLPPFPPGTQSDHLTIDATMHFVLIR